MSIIARDPHFSWSSPLDDDVASEKTTFTSNSSTTQSCHAKQIERRLVNAWKTLTRSTRKQKRVSVYAKEFVFVTAAASNKRGNMLLQQPRQSCRSQQATQPNSRTHGYHSF